MMWRQGDILFQTIEQIPFGVARMPNLVLASGDSTSHRHMIKDRKTAELFRSSNVTIDDLFLNVTANEASVVHPEHNTIVLPKGCYRVWHQREFGEDKKPKRVVD